MNSFQHFKEQSRTAGAPTERFHRFKRNWNQFGISVQQKSSSLNVNLFSSWYIKKLKELVCTVDTFTEMQKELELLLIHFTICEPVPQSNHTPESSATCKRNWNQFGYLIFTMRTSSSVNATTQLWLLKSVAAKTEASCGCSRVATPRGGHQLQREVREG